MRLSAFNWTQLDDSNGAVPIDGCAEYAAGYDVEIAKRIADGLGRELVIVKTEWSGSLPALTSVKLMRLSQVCHLRRSAKKALISRPITTNQIWLWLLKRRKV